jgi:hypothetical protein
MGVVKSNDRFRVQVFVVASVLVLAAASVLRVSMPSQFAPRVRVRWSSTLEDGRRAALEQQFSLFRGERHDVQTWEYDLADPSRELVTSLVAYPDVADTHYIERGTGRIASDAPVGTIRLRERWFAALIHSFVFDWFLLFWASAIVVSGAWLASGPAARD